MRTIRDISNFLLSIEDTIQTYIHTCKHTYIRYIPTITGGRICNDEERKLLYLPTRYGGLAIPTFHKQAEVEYINSWRTTTELTSLITAQQIRQASDQNIKLEIKNEKENRYKNVMEHLKDNKSKRLLQLSNEKGVSNWLTMLPIAEYGFEL